MRIIVLGANGQAGSVLKRITGGNTMDQWIFFDRNEADVTSREMLLELADRIKPQVIVNFAALTDVDELENNPDAAFAVNGVGAGNAAEAADSVGAKLIHLSTDYVFDGSGIRDNGRLRPYRESDLPDPQTIYGKSKLLGEKLILSRKSRHLVIRTAWLFGENKCFIKEILRQAYEGRVIRVVNDQTGSPTYIDELVEAVTHLIMTDVSGLYHAANQGQVTRYGLACFVLRHVHSKSEIIPVPTEAMPDKAVRPAYSALDIHRLNQLGIYRFSPWEKAVTRYLGNHAMIFD